MASGKSPKPWRWHQKVEARCFLRLVETVGARTRSGRPDRVEEFADFELEPVAFTRQRFRRRVNLRGGRSGLGCAMLHVGDVGGYLVRPHRRVLDVARYFLR